MILHVCNVANLVFEEVRHPVCQLVRLPEGHVPLPSSAPEEGDHGPVPEPERHLLEPVGHRLPAQEDAQELEAQAQKAPQETVKSIFFHIKTPSSSTGFELGR